MAAQPATRIVLELEDGADRIGGLISVSGGSGGESTAERFSGYVELIAALETARARALPVGDPERAKERPGGSGERPA